MGSVYRKNLVSVAMVIMGEWARGNDEMASIYFVGPYKPIMCGIADYTSFLTRESPFGRWGVISFDLERYGAPLVVGDVEAKDRVWYGIPSRREVSASMILEGLEKLGARKEEGVLWFQHEFGIWHDSQSFVDMLRNLDMAKIVSLHSVHYQTRETPTGLRSEQYDLLQGLLPHVQAITVFGHGVYRAVISTFPEHANKVHILKHGVHSFPEIRRLSRKEAKKKLNHFLVHESSLDQATKEILLKQGTFLDPETVVVGQTGFLSPFKDTTLLYSFKDDLQNIIPHKRIVAVRIGCPASESERIYAEKLRREQNGRDKLLLEIWLPQNILALAQRATDINFYWPSDCTQSGVIAHALGAGAIVACRDLEGVGETLKEAGELVDTNLRHLLVKSKNLILHRELRERLEEMVLKYATEFAWANQARRHYELAEHIVAARASQVTIDAIVISRTTTVGETIPAQNLKS